MHDKPRIGAAGRWLAGSAGLAAGAYAAYVAVAWTRYGRVPSPRPDERDELLDRFIPIYDVVERHHVRVAAPADVTLGAAREMDLSRSPFVRAIFKGRELLLGAEPAKRSLPKGILADVQAVGWGILAETAGREVVVGAVTRPWEPNVTFRALPAADFAAFSEPEYVKIAWTLRADPIGPTDSIFRTETRALATDAAARARFRRYWSFLSPGIGLIRLMSLGPVKREAERRASAAQAALRGASPDSQLPSPRIP